MNTNQNFPQNNFNTLAQSETKGFNKVRINVSGKGSDLTDIKALRGRAKRKMITIAMIKNLIDVVHKKKQHHRKKGYWNTFHCQNRLFSSGEKYYGQYCKNRHCTLCCSIRKAVIINKYLPVISKWQEPYFVTLTAKSVKLPSLGKRISDMNRGFRLICSKYRKKAIRNKGVKFVGIKSLECNFNPELKTYNPHLHLLVETKEMAEIIIKEWLLLCTPKFANKAAQNMRKVDDRIRDLIEIVKYGSKILTEPDVNKKAKQKYGRNLYSAALDNIFKAMKGIRIFERFGFNLPKIEPEILGANELRDFEEWVYDNNRNDWINKENGFTLTGYLASDELIDLLNTKIDTELE